MNQAELSFFESQGISYNGIIAQGGYGVVYEVYSSKYKSNFALKKIPQQAFSDSEIECLKAIDDPRIVRLYQTYNFNNYIYLLMEYCSNDLDKMFKHKRISSEDELYRYVYDTILAVKACHDRNIAHSDIKPANFLVDQYGRIKISDFGLSSCYAGEHKCCIFKGTKLFMAPEIFSKKEYDPYKADMWSLGVTIYYIATHHYPFVDKDVNKIQEYIINGDYNKERIKDPLLAEVIQACLEKNPVIRVSIDEILRLPYFNQDTEISIEGFNQSALPPLYRQIPQSISRGHFVAFKPMIAKRKSAFGIEQMNSLTNFKCMRLHMNKSEVKFSV